MSVWYNKGHRALQSMALGCAAQRYSQRIGNMKGGGIPRRAPEKISGRYLCGFDLLRKVN